MVTLRRISLSELKRSKSIEGDGDLSLSALLQAELEYCIEHERVCSLSDFVIQRSGMLYFNRAWINQHQELLKKPMKKNVKGHS